MARAHPGSSSRVPPDTDSTVGDAGKEMAMDVGIGLPNAVRGVDRAGIVDWAVRAERAGFSTLGTIDRIVYDNYESLIALAAAAAVTERIGLATDIMIAPLRAHTALMATQA